MMKTEKPQLVSFLSLILISILIPTAASAQSKDFMNSPNEGWLVNIEEAYELSNKTNRPILANFTGSDWCGWCKKLKSEVFSQPGFKEWAAKNVILLELDFPRNIKLPDTQARQNQELMRAFQVSGYPTIWIFDLKRPEGTNQFQIQAYGKTGYVQGGVPAFIENANNMIELKKQSN